MNLTPPTPAPKRVRAKTAPAAGPKTESAKKPTLTTKAKRAPKKLVEPASTVPTIDSAVHAVARAEAGASYTSDQVRALIEKAAYYRAESRHFAPGNDLEDWLVAEQQVIAGLT